MSSLKSESTPIRWRSVSVCTIKDVSIQVASRAIAYRIDIELKRDKAKEGVAGYEARIKKYIEELKVSSIKVNEGEAAMAKLRFEMSESRKTVNEVRHKHSLVWPSPPEGLIARLMLSHICFRPTRCALRSYANSWRLSSASSQNALASSSSKYAQFLSNPRIILYST